MCSSIIFMMNNDKYDIKILTWRRSLSLVVLVRRASVLIPVVPLEPVTGRSPCYRASRCWTSGSTGPPGTSVAPGASWTAVLTRSTWSSSTASIAISITTEIVSKNNLRSFEITAKYLNFAITKDILIYFFKFLIIF